MQRQSEKTKKKTPNFSLVDGEQQGNISWEVMPFKGHVILVEVQVLEIGDRNRENWEIAWNVYFSTSRDPACLGKD